MADFPTNAAPLLDVVASTFSPTEPRFEEPYVGHLLVESEATNGYESVGSGHPPAPPRDDHATIDAPWMAIGWDWFDRVHLIPRSKIQFGNIITTVTATFEIFNAHRTTVVMVDHINPVDGLTIPDLPTPPAPLGPFVSFTDVDSVALAWLPLEIIVSREGEPVFDEDLIFEFSDGSTLVLEVSGTRIQLLVAIYEADFQERLSFLSDPIEAARGKEQVLALRQNPRQSFQVQYRLDGHDRQRLHALLFGAQAQILAFPLWHEDVFSTAAASLAATSIAVRGAAEVDFRVGGYAVVYEGATKFDVVLLSAVTDTLLSFTTTPLTHSYGSGMRVAPVRLVIITSEPKTSRQLVTLESFSLAVQVLDNDTGALAGSTAGWSLFDGKILFDDCNVFQGNVPTALEHKLTIIDNRTGAVQISTKWDKNKRSTQKTFVAHSRAELLKLRKLLTSLRGQQKPFYLPSRIEDFTVVANLVLGASTMDITNIGYTRNVRSRAPRNVFRITFTDGTSLDRTISSSTEVSEDVERLTLNTTWPANRTVAQIRRVEYLVLSRFDADDFVLAYSRSGFARMVAPVRDVFV